ncbi:MAG TPA: amino acid adenylation domain-containing protein, partial [Longimicrobium sp.]|nr:amino acid adenylation domain-containing protein [Longimicrobium sp.]
VEGAVALQLVEEPEPLLRERERARLWFLDRLEPGSAFYNIPAAFRLAGALDAGALERSLGEVVRRHDALRTVFREVDGAPVQIVRPFDGFALPVDDLSALDDAKREAEVRRRVAEDAGRPFDLAAGPLFRAALLKLGAEEHVLLLSMHHIAGDGWSFGVLFRELAALYAAFVAGGESPLAELPVQYADYAVWQREQLRGAALERPLAYWKARLAGAPALLELPADHPRPAAQTYRGASEPVELPLELFDRLDALAQREGATLNMVLLGAFQALLARYAGVDDVVVGSPVAGRTRPEVEGVIGLFANPLVLRVDLGGDPSFREVLRRVREATLGAYEHQEVPFDRLVEELRPERSLSHAPLFQVMFTLDDAQGVPALLPGVRAERVDAEATTTKFDLTLSLGSDGGRLRGAITYGTDLFDRPAIQRMAGHLERVLDQVSARPDARLSEIELPSAQERDAVLHPWSPTEAAYPSACIHQLFEGQAALTPDAVAVVHEETSLTYGELNARANRLARHLRRQGVGPEVRVGVCLERGVDLVVALMGVLKAGGAYVPLDPAYPTERLERTLADASVAVLVTQEKLRGLLAPPPEVHVVVAERDAAAIAAEPAENVESGVTPRNLAYLIYTSGSTGVPKGVAIEHESAVVMLAWSWTVYSDEELGGMLASTSVAFDMSVFELFAPLGRGGRVIVVENALALATTKAADQVRLVDTVPSAIAALLRMGGIPAGVRTVNLGGEPLKAELVDALYASGVERVYDMYGPSEDTTFSTCALRQPGGPVTIGRVLPNSQAYVLDAALRLLPVGVPGELYLGGKGVTRGYLGRPGLTAERYVPDPFSVEPGARMYRTGDRIRWKADGTLEYLGRLDHQVKVRGFRVETGEVEAWIRRFPGVADCVVMARADDAGETRLVGYVVGPNDAEALKAHLRKALPDYMVPAAFVFLDALPLTPNGKLDRKALPAPEHVSAAAYVAPRTEVEEALAGVWAEVLRLDRVGVEESFFDLGGHSLLATRVVSRIRDVLGAELPLRAVFEAPTVAALAGAVEAAWRAGAARHPSVVPVGRDRPLPLSFAQERLWFLDQLESDSAFYNIPTALRLSGALDVGALERALGEVVRRHESLRTTFPEVDGAPVQAVAPFGGFALAVDDLSALDETRREAEVRRRVAEDAGRPFDLAAGPLFRAALLRLGAEEHVLLLSMHHVVSDGWSFGVLFRELSALYEAYVAGEEPPLPELPVQYADFAVWQRAQLRGEALERQLAYWKGRLTGAPALLELPTDRPRPAVQTYRGAEEAVELPAGLLERLETLGRGEGATLYMVLLGAFQLLLSKYAGTDDVVVGSPMAGRTRGEVEGLIGFFVNTLVLRTDLSGDPTFRELLGRVRDTTLGAYEHQEVPFERLVEVLQPERSLSHAPLFQVMFTQEDVEGTRAALPGLRAESVDAEVTTTKFDLTLSLGSDDGRLRGSITYSTALFDRETIRRMAAHLERVLEQVSSRPDARLSEVELPSAEERDVVLHAWNRTEAGFPAERCIHQLIEDQAERTPDAVAVVFEDDAVTYRELNARANRLAHRLVRLGVGPEVRVGLCLERSVEMVVSILAVLKAGGAYVPLDPGYPAERLAYMLEDSGVPVLLTQERLRSIIPASDATVLAVDSIVEEIASEPAENPTPAVSPSNLAYVIYTSGSTGRPKGAMNAHRGVVNRLWWMQAEYGIGAKDVILQKTPFSFDVSVWEFFWPLQQGARLVMARPDGHRDPAYLAEVIETGGVTTLHFVPSMLQQFVEEADSSRCGSLQRVICSGEALPPALVARFHERFPATVGLHNLYGPTEAAVDVSYWACERGDATGVVPIGRPVWNTQLYVLDAALRPVPVGVPGELYIGGVQVARGYLDRPGLTAERFVPDAFAADPGARLYRTGDKVRWRTNGALEYLGRLDEQVKIRGLRIELGEIEAAIRRHEGVTDCVVVARADAAGEKRLVAYVVGEAEVEALKTALRRSLPEYMVPSAFVFLDALPLSPNGKLDRKALPAPEFGGTSERYVAPRTEVEAALAGVWAEVLRLERVGVEESFFDLGGHSLLATRVVSRVREVLRVELP